MLNHAQTRARVIHCSQNFFSQIRTWTLTLELLLKGSIVFAVLIHCPLCSSAHLFKDIDDLDASPTLYEHAYRSQSCPGWQAIKRSTGNSPAVRDEIKSQDNAEGLHKTLSLFIYKLSNDHSIEGDNLELSL